MAAHLLACGPRLAQEHSDAITKCLPQQQLLNDSVEKVWLEVVLKHFSIRHVEVKRFRACGFSGV